MLGAELRALRERRGLTVGDCAQHSGIAESTLKKIESGANYPTLTSLEGLASCLHVRFVIGPDETFIEPLD